MKKKRFARWIALVLCLASALSLAACGDSGCGWISAGSGRIDLTGRPLGEALYTKVAFELEKGPFIAVRPLCHEGKHSPSSWKMTNAMPSWSWRGCEGKTAHVEVYARAAGVELFVNGASKGRKSFKNDCLFTFRVPYENGTIEAVSYDAGGTEIGRNKLTAAGEETVLQAVPETESVKAGHLAFIRLKYTDKPGETKPTERGIIDVSVEGGKLRALGSACPYYERSYLDSSCDTYYGEALAIVEAGEAGPLRLHASDGSLSAETEMEIID